VRGERAHTPAPRMAIVLVAQFLPIEPNGGFA
jgi:hypothetical protein